MKLSDLVVRFTSRKFLLAVLGMIVVLGVNLTSDQLTALTALIVAFTAAEGAKDYIEAKAGL